MKRKPRLGGHEELSNPNITQGERVSDTIGVFCLPAESSLSNAIKKILYDHSMICGIIGSSAQHHHQT